MPRSEFDDPKIRVLKPSLPPLERIASYLQSIDASRQYTNFGPLVQRFEARMAHLLGASDSVTTSSATLALELCLAALDLPAGGLVALPSVNFPSAAHAILSNGHLPLFCDVNAETGLMEIDAVPSEFLGMPVVAIMPTCLHGCGYSENYWDNVVEERGVPVILDAAGGIGYQKAGRLHATVYSLHATKPLSSGEGGLIVSEDSDLCRVVRAMSNFGFDHAQTVFRGTNAKMSEYHAAVGLAALDGWPELIDAFTRKFADYRIALGGNASGMQVVNRSGVTNTLTVLFDRGARETARRRLARAGVETRMWYLPPLHTHPRFAKLHRAGDLTVTEDLAQRLLGLPYGPHVGQDEFVRIAELLED